MTPPELCPVCGAEVPPAAHACPECGADEMTGWDADRTAADGLDLPDEVFDYDEYRNREFGDAGQPEKKRWPWLCIVGLIFVLLALIIW